MRSRRWLPALVVVAALVGVASAAGAQVDPSPGPAVWTSTCVAPGPTQLVVYGRGWQPGLVRITLGGVDVGTATPASGVFQTKVTITAPADGEVVLAAEGAQTATYRITVSGACPSISAAVPEGTCGAAAQQIEVDLTVSGLAAAEGPATFAHYVDLFGPAERIDRRQPTVTNGGYTLKVLVGNVPGRPVPVTVERNVGGTFTYATAIVALPPACAPGTTATTAPPTTTGPGPATTAPATTAPPTTAAPVTPLPPLVLPPSFLPGGAPSLSLSPALGVAGQATTVAGTGFGPSATVTLRWRPGVGEWTVRAGGDGSFRTQVLVLPKDIEGPRVLEAIGAAPASAAYLVVPGSQQPAFGGVFVRG